MSKFTQLVKHLSEADATEHDPNTVTRFVMQNKTNGKYLTVTMNAYYKYPPTWEDVPEYKCSTARKATIEKVLQAFQKEMRERLESEQRTVDYYLSGPKQEPYLPPVHVSLQNAQQKLAKTQQDAAEINDTEIVTYVFSKPEEREEYCISVSRLMMNLLPFQRVGGAVLSVV